MKPKHAPAVICEWLKSPQRGVSDAADSSCGKIAIIYSDFRFCPYCGGRIKVKEQ